MDAIRELHAIAEGLWFWQGYEPAVKCDLSCCAIAVPFGLVFVDPLPLEEPPLARLTASHPPAAIILTNGNHERHALVLRKRFRIPIYAHREIAAEIGADHVVDDGARILDALAVIGLPGAGPGEIGLTTLSNPRALILGDILVNLPPHGLRPLPDKYCTDPSLAKTSLRRLLAADFQLLLLAHGPPVADHAIERLRHAVEQAES